MTNQLKLLKKLIEKGCKIYGSSKCGFCKKQIEIFTNEEAKKLFLEKVYKNVQDMEEKPKVNGFPTLVYRDKKITGFKTLENLENILDNFGKIKLENENKMKKIEQLKKQIERKKFDIWIEAEDIEILPNEKNEKGKIIFSNISNIFRYQIYNEFNKELKKERIINKMSPFELNKHLTKALKTNWNPTCYFEYELNGDEKPQTLTFDLKKSNFNNGELIFKVYMYGMDGLYTVLGKNGVCNLNSVQETRMKINRIINNFVCN